MNIVIVKVRKVKNEKEWNKIFVFVSFLTAARKLS